MEFNGKDDYLARWIHGICALPLAGMSYLFIRYFPGLYRTSSGWTLGLVIGCSLGHVACRCAFYAITGRANINEDEMWRIHRR